jgi:hypothetical protein
MKATFLLPAMSLSALWLAFGFEALWSRPATRRAAIGLVATLALVAALGVVAAAFDIDNALQASARKNQLWRYPGAWWAS